jgi:hypothetical protein
VATATPLGLPAHNDQDDTILHNIRNYLHSDKKVQPKKLE